MKKIACLMFAASIAALAGCAADAAEPEPVEVHPTTAEHVEPKMMSTGGNIWCYNGYCCPASKGCGQLYTGSCYASSQTGNGCYATF